MTGLYSSSLRLEESSNVGVHETRATKTTGGKATGAMLGFPEKGHIFSSAELFRGIHVKSWKPESSKQSHSLGVAEKRLGVDSGQLNG